MNKENITIERWKTQFKGTAQHLANKLIVEAKTKNTYGEAIAYIRETSQQAYGDITDPEDRAGTAVSGAICSLVVRRPHEEERSLSISKED